MDYFDAIDLDCFDLIDWIIEHKPAVYAAIRYLPFDSQINCAAEIYVKHAARQAALITHEQMTIAFD